MSLSIFKSVLDVVNSQCSVNICSIFMYIVLYYDMDIYICRCSTGASVGICGHFS